MWLALISLANALTLEDAWQAADRQGVDAALVREQYAAAKTITGAAWSLVSPKLVLRGNYTRNDEELTFDTSAFIPPEFATLFPESEPMVVQKLSFFDANLSVIQPLFSGQAIPLLRAAYGQVAASEEDMRGNQAKLRTGVAQAFWGALVAREGTVIAEGALASAKKHRELVAKQEEVGLAPKTARLQAEIAESRAMRELAAAQEGRVQAETAFAQLTGLPADTPLTMPEPRALPWSSAEAAIEAAEERNPSIAAARLRERAAGQAATARALGWLPTIDGRFTYVWTENTTVFNDRPEFWQVVVTGEWLLWDGGYRLSEQAKSAAEKRMAVLARQRAESSTTAEIQVLWERHEKATRALATVEREAALAAEHLRLAEVAWEAGSLTFLELEDARLGEKAARLGVLQERMGRDLADIALLAAVGAL